MKKFTQVFLFAFFIASTSLPAQAIDTSFANTTVEVVKNTDISNLDNVVLNPTITPEATPTAFPTPTLISTENGSVATFTLIGDGDIMNEEGTNGGSFVSADTSWIGTGGSADESYFGVRFHGALIPENAKIKSAKVILTNNYDNDQLISMAFTMRAEKTKNPAAFSPDSLLSKRTELTGTAFDYGTSDKGIADNWIKGGTWEMDVTSVVKDLQDSKNLGDTVSLIAKGRGKAYGRKFFYNNKHQGIQELPQLVVEFE